MNTATTGAEAPPPSLARLLGYAGALPFVAAALLAWALDGDARAAATTVLAAYAATIVSFLGGIHWGFGFLRGDPARFVWGVVPSLLAWAALLLPRPAGLVLLAVTLAACYLVDRGVYRALGLQRWLPLRLQLSSVAALCCVAGALA
jgi:hypothetical protein